MTDELEEWIDWDIEEEHDQEEDIIMYQVWEVSLAKSVNLGGSAFIAAETAGAAKAIEHREVGKILGMRYTDWRARKVAGKYAPRGKVEMVA